MKRTIALISVLMLALMISACAPGGNLTDSSPALQHSAPAESSAATESSTATEPPATEPPVTEPLITEPPVTEPPVTEPPSPPPTDADEMIGSLYTRKQLEALSSKRQGYGPGVSENGSRPPYAVQLQNKFQKYDAHFIAEDNKTIYLTFSLGYEHENLTATFLDILKEKNVKAVFFVNYGYASRNSQLINRMIDEGHILASHATNHYDMGTISIDLMVSEITTIHNYVRNTYGYEMKLFRPPSGYYNEQLLAVAQSLGYKTVNWSYAYKDWDTEDQPDSGESLEKMVNSLHNGAIYALHTVSETNSLILGDFIDSAVASGYQFALFS